MFENQVSLDLTTQPVRDDLYEDIDASTSVYYGTIIKNMYDHTRLNIPGGEHVKHQVVNLHTRINSTKYIYGIKLPNPLLALKLLADFSDEIDDADDTYIDRYMEHVSSYGVGCEESYNNIARGILCVDGVYLNDITEDVPLNIFQVDHEQPQWYLKYASSHIYILH
jgi:hypothetical protein